MLRAVCTALLLASVVACVTPPGRMNSGSSSISVRPAVGEPFRLRAGQVASVGGGELAVVFRGVTRDSRCPADVNCVWAGDAVVAIVTTAGSAPGSQADLHTGVEPRQVQAGNHAVTLVALEPSTRQGVQIRPGDYLAVLRVDRR